MSTYFLALSDRLLVGDGEWTERLVGRNLECVAADERAPDRAFVGTVESGLQRTTDGGETWLDHPSGGRRDNHTVSTHPDAPDRVYTAAGDGYALSTDRGETWNHSQEGLDRRYVWSVAVHPDDPDTVVVSAANGAYAAYSTTGESAIYRWTGGEWTTAMDGLPASDGLARAVLTSDTAGFLALTNHGLFRSAEGTEWRMVGTWGDAYDQVPRGLAVA